MKMKVRGGPQSSTVRCFPVFRAKSVLLLCIILAAIPYRYPFVNSFVVPEENPYKVLGVKSKDRQNMDKIRKAYHDKAKAAHPDKNPDMDPQKANERFIRIKEAWDYLSDIENKRRYDDHLRNQHRQNHPPTRARQEERERARRKEQKDAERRLREEERRKEEHARKVYLEEQAKRAQQYLLKLATLDQLHGESALFDSEKMMFKKHFLCVFVGDKKQERTATVDYLFPYPFGPSNELNSLDWTEILQTAKVRYNKPTPLTKIFRVPTRTNKPFIVFAKKGSRLDRREFEIFQFNKHKGSGEPYEELKQWVVRQTTSTISVVNRFHDGGPTIKIFFDNGNNLISAGRPVPPGFKLEFSASISDRLIVLDGNTDKYFGHTGVLDMDLSSRAREQSIIDRNAIDTLTVKEEEERFEVGRGYGTTRVCYDLAMKCIHFATRSNCEKQSDFMHTMCAKSCGVCVESHNWNAVNYVLVHLPLHKIPNILGLPTIVSYMRIGVGFAKVFLHDVTHLWEKRRNVMFAFFFTGLQLGIQIVLVARMLFGNNPARIRDYRAYAKVDSSSSMISLVLLILSTSFTFGAKFWLSVKSKNEIPKILWDFQSDLRAMERISPDLVSVVFGLGIISFLLSYLWTRRLRNHLILREILLLVSAVLITTILVIGTGYHLRNDSAGHPQKLYRYQRWINVWKFRKNVAVSIMVSGNLVGALFAGIARFLKQHRQVLNSVPSIANIGLWLGLVLLAFRQDRFFHEDLKHVVDMRMSAAIPCIILGIVWGLIGAHLISTYRVKVKVD